LSFSFLNWICHFTSCDTLSESFEAESVPQTKRLENSFKKLMSFSVGSGVGMKITRHNFTKDDAMTVLY